MRQAFIVFIRAIGVYALLTLPVLSMPFIYITSLFYVLVYGWIACAVFMAGYWLILQLTSNRYWIMCWLSLLVFLSVGIAFHILGLFNPELDAWNSGAFLLFPAGAALAGIISLFVSETKIIANSNANQKQ